MQLMSAPSSEQVTALLGWFATHRRPLPWRVDDGRPDPYAVLVSEVMAQQTRVETVIGHFGRWMRELPDLAALANAEEQTVLNLWTGLGYYRRARNLHRCAQVAIDRHGGIPADILALRELPGIGPYTAGAIASIAFGLPCALVDGNVARVLARWHAIDTDVMTGPGKRRTWQLAEQWLDNPAVTADPGRWNEALMELGALVCTPRKPMCAVCPVAPTCLARKSGRTETLPVPRRRTKVIDVLASYALLSRGDALLLGRRSNKGRWPGLWEPPGFEGADGADRLTTWLAAEGLVACGPAKPMVHILSHRRYQALAHPVILGAKTPDLRALGYVEQRLVPADIALADDSGLSRLAQRLIAQG